MESEVVTLWKEQVGVCDILSPSLEHDLIVEQWRDRFHHLLLGIKTYVLTEKLDNATKEFTFSVPTSRWQTIKRDHLPNFVRWRLVPRVKTQEHKVTATVQSEAWFPEASIITPELGKPVHMRKVIWDVSPGV